MRKLIALLLAIVTAISLCACGTENKIEDNGFRSSSFINESVIIESNITDNGSVISETDEMNNESVLTETDEATNEAPIQETELYGEWVDSNSGNELLISAEQIEYSIIGKSSGMTGGTYLNWDVVDDVLSVDGFCDFIISTNGEYITLSSEEYSFIPVEYYNATVQQIELGETITTDSAELTIHRLTYSDTVSKYDLAPSGDGYWTGDYDTTFACFEFTLTNNSKSTKNLVEMCQFEIDYNNGYIFGENMTGSYAEKNWTFGYMHYENGLGSGTSLKLNPLSTTVYNGCIACPIKVSEDTTSPLKIIVKLFSESGMETFEFIVQ